MTRIIHLSDLHIGYKDYWKRSERIVNNILAREKPGESIIVITGDIADYGASAEDLTDGLKLLAELRGHGFTVLICPGNHDYGTGFANSEKTAEHFRKLFLPEVKEFPHLEIIDNLAFIGLDSTADELHWYDRYFADGELGKEQLDRLEQMVNDPALKDKVKIVYLHHHPIHFLPFFQLKDRGRLRKIVEGKVDVLLFGHLHFGGTYHNTWRIKVVIDGGSSTGRLALGLFGINIKHRVVDLSDFSVKETDYLSGPEGS
ncbi:MAG TPA: metallophosphoesterase [Candidatus Omnitrophota bacterium]|nr:metallophosphoesterase [Candidatus Omnitrophota bacterium]